MQNQKPETRNMKHILIIVLLSLSMGINAQITIDANDMPNVGDTIRKSITTFGAGYNFSQTGNDFVWDYSNLSLLTQDVDSFISVGSTPFIYQIAFNNPFDPAHRATIALPTDDFNFIPGFELTDIIDYYKETSSKYVKVGMGITIIGIPISMKYDIPELLYNFPLTVGNVDSTTSSFNLQIPLLGFYSTTIKRINEVDGWGTLTTPFGTHPVIRVKSTILQTDSIYIDSLGFGLPINRTMTEYKWLGNNFGIPLLKVTVEGILTTIEYIDNSFVPPFALNLGLPKLICEGDTTVIKANVSGGCPPYSFLWNTGSTVDSIIVHPLATTTYTVTVIDACNDTLDTDVMVIINPTPVVDLGNDTTIYPADTLVLDAGGGLLNTYLWSDGSQGQTLIVDTAGTYWVEVTNFSGCTASDTIIVSIGVPPANNIYGTITYDNAFSTPLAGVKVLLLNNALQKVDSVNSDSIGNYQFQNVVPGTYTIVVQSDHPWGGVNATDALFIMQHFTGLNILLGLRLIAADVDLSNYINSVDALYAAQRFVLLINSFPAGDWIFESPSVTVDGSGPVVVDILGLCVGDTDGSFIP